MYNISNIYFEPNVRFDNQAAAQTLTHNPAQLSSSHHCLHFQMYPRYEYTNLDIASFEQSPTFEQPPSYPSIAYDPHTQFLPEIETNTSKQKCRVCNLESHGMHFGVQTCRPCAAFFRRIVVLNLKYTCVSSTQKCNVDGRGRNVCRDCRYKKCIAVGMTSDNVQYNRDSHNNKASGRAKNRRREIMTTDEEDVARSSTVKIEDPNSEESCSGCSDGEPDSSRIRMLEDVEERDSEEMDKIISNLKNLFVEYEPPKMISLCSSNQLQKLTHALILYRQNQQSANHIKFWDKINLYTDGKVYYQRRSEKFSKWVKSVDFFDSLSDEDKITAVKMSFTAFDRLERVHMSIKVFGEQAYTEKKTVLSSYCAIDLRSCEVNPETHVNTEHANNYVKTEFYKHAETILEEICKPLIELQLSDTEITFLLVQVLVYDGEKAPAHLVKKFDELREQVAADIHHHYTQNRKFEVYSSRLLKIINVVTSMKKIQADRVRKSELIRVFDVYKVSDKRQEFNCS